MVDFTITKKHVAVNSIEAFILIITFNAAYSEKNWQVILSKAFLSRQMFLKKTSSLHWSVKKILVTNSQSRTFYENIKPGSFLLTVSNRCLSLSFSPIQGFETTSN